MKLKLRIFALMAMLLCFAFQANAQFAKIGETEYSTFGDALTAAGEMSGDVTVEVYGKVTLNTAFSGNYSSINFVGAEDTDAEIYLDVQGYITATGKKVSFTDLTLSKSEGGSITNAGFMNVAFGVYDVVEVVYTNCVFANGAYASSGNVTYTGCTFKKSWDKYGLWAYGDVNVTVDGCVFDDYRGIKMYAEGKAKTTELTVKKTDFSALAVDGSKPAIVLTCGASVVLEKNTYSRTGTFELDLDGDPNGTAVTSDVAPVCVNDNGACGVLVDGKIYTTVAQAAAVATEGSNVTLLYSTTDTVEFAEGVNLTLANGVTADNVTVKVTAPVEVANFETLKAAVEAGKKVKLTADITVDESITVNDGTELDLNEKTLYINVENSFYNNVTIKNGNIVLGKDDVHVCDGYFEVNAGKTLVLDGVNMSSSAEGIKGYAVFHLKIGANLDLLNSTLNIADNEYAAGYIVYAGEATATVDVVKTTITGSKVNGIVHATTLIDESIVTLTNVIEHGINRSGVTIDDSNVAISGGTGRGITAQHGDLVITGNSTVEISDMGEATIELRNDKNLSIEETATVTLDVAVNNTSGGTISGDVVLPVYVAQIGDVKYTDLREAMVAATASDIVIMLDNVDLAGTEWEPVAFKGTFDGKDKVIKNLTINKPDVANTGFITSLNGTFKNVTFTNPTVTGGENTAVVAGRAGGSAALAENITINGTIKVETTHTGYARAAAIVGGWGYGNYKNITVDGGDKAASYIKHSGGGDGRYVAGIVGHADDVQSYDNCTVKNITISGGWLCGAIAGPGPADGLATGCVVENVDMGADYSGGMFGWYFGSGTIEDATIKNVTFIDGSTCNGAIGGYSNNTNANVSNVIIENVKNNDGAPLLNHVAKVGEVGYETLAAALAAAKDGETVTLLWAEGDPAIAMNAAVFGKNVTITGTATVDWSKGWFYVGRGGAGNATVTFDGANLTSASANENSGLGIHVSGREKDTNNKYDGTLVINNSTIALDYLINRGAIELGEGAVLTVKNGFGIAGRPASETENGEAATATVTLNNGSKLVVNNHNGMGLGQAATNPEGYGVMNVNEGATFEATQNFLVTANGTMNVAAGGAVNVNGTLTVNGTLVCAGNIAATIAAGDAANIEISGGVYTQNVAEWCIDGYAALPDLKGNYVVGEEPTATVNNLGATTIAGGEYSIYDGSYKETTAADPGMPLSFVMQFLADQDEDDMVTSPYADWYGDFVLTFTGLENDSFSAEGCYLAGYYGSFGWVKVPVKGLLDTIEQGVRYPVMLGVGFGQKYDYICTGVKDFRCALYIPETVLEANPNIEVKLELSVVDNSKGSIAAAEALVNGENIYEVGAYEYEAKDFNPGYLRDYTINDADALDYTQAEDKKIGTLTYNRTLIEGIWNPLYLPFSVSLKDLADNYEVAYYNTMHSYDNDNNGTFETFEMEVLKLTANELNDVMLKANYPYFIRPKNADACTLQIVETDATLFAAAEKVITTTSVSHTFQLKSTHKALDAAALTGCYAISTDGDWALTAGLKPHRLYLTISANDDSPYATTAAKTIRIVARGDEGFEGTTGVDIVETDNAADGTIYDLSGRPVEEPVKGGMYIINGKKVVY